MAILLRTARKETRMRSRPESVTSADHRNTTWNSARFSPTSFPMQSALFVKRWDTCLRIVPRLPMGSSTREEVAISVGQTSIRNSTVQKEERRKMSSISSSKIFK